MDEKKLARIPLIRVYRIYLSQQRLTQWPQLLQWYATSPEIRRASCAPGLAVFANFESSLVMNVLLLITRPRSCGLTITLRAPECSGSARGGGGLAAQGDFRNWWLGCPPSPFGLRRASRRSAPGSTARRRMARLDEGIPANHNRSKSWGSLAGSLVLRSFIVTLRQLLWVARPSLKSIVLTLDSNQQPAAPFASPAAW